MSEPELCRLCAETKRELIGIYDAEGQKLAIEGKIAKCLQIQVKFLFKNFFIFLLFDILYYLNNNYLYFYNIVDTEYYNELYAEVYNCNDKRKLRLINRTRN